jgi:hypothetical protein
MEHPPNGVIENAGCEYRQISATMFAYVMAYGKLTNL